MTRPGNGIPMGQPLLQLVGVSRTFERRVMIR